MISTLRRENERVNLGTVAGIDNIMRDVESNREFTSYIEENYERLVKEVIKFGINPEFAVDLINDVWQSYKIDEANNNCYNAEKGNKDGFISVEQAVYGRIKRYSQNKRYHRITEAPKYNEHTKKYEVKEIPASFNSEDLDNMTACQKQYALMGSYDELSVVEDKLALAENIQYLLGFGNRLGMPVLNVIEVLLKMRNNLSNIDMSLFNGFREAGREFREAFSIVLTAAMRDPDFFEEAFAKARAEFESVHDVIAQSM